MKYVLALVGFVALVALSVNVVHKDKQAMAVCEKHSSHDECFYALNR